MTTYAPNFTPRYKATYVVGGIQHTIQVRAARGSAAFVVEGLKDIVGQCFDALAAAVMSDLLWINAEYALTDSDDFVPSVVPTITTAPTFDESTIGPRARIRGLTFSGRATGSKARFTMFGVYENDTFSADDGSDGTITPSELPGLSTVLTLAANNFHSGSGQLATWHQRATYKENDHLLRLVRRGIIT